MNAQIGFVELANKLYEDKTRGELRDFNELFNSLFADFGSRGALGSTVAFQTISQKVRTHIEEVIESYISAAQEAKNILDVIPDKAECEELIAKGQQILEELVKRTKKRCENQFPAPWFDEFDKITKEQEAKLEFRLGQLLRLAHRHAKSEDPSRHAEDLSEVARKGRLYDAFICYASEDKDNFVRPLAELLREKGFQIWFDEFELQVGDSLRRSIDRGLASSRFGIVVLSEAFFKKEWPQRELDGLASLEVGGKQVILPIWHKITKEQVESYSPTLADKYALRTNADKLEKIADQLCRRFRERREVPASSQAPNKTTEVKHARENLDRSEFTRRKVPKRVPSQKDVYNGHPRTIYVKCPKCGKVYDETHFDNEDATGDIIDCECGLSWIVG